MRRKFNKRGKRMSNQTSRTIRLIPGVVALIFIFLWSCAPMVMAMVNTNKAETAISQKEEFTTNTTPVTLEVEKETLNKPEVSTECQEVTLQVQAQITTTKPVTSEESEVLVQTKEEDKIQKFNLTEEEKEMFAAIIYLEGGGESYECQLGIGSVILNRLENGHWGDTLESVLYAKNQFTPAHRIKTTTPKDMQRRVVEQLLTEGTTLPYYVMYFRAWYYFDWAEPYTHIDKTYFSYLEKDK